MNDIDETTHAPASAPAGCGCCRCSPCTCTDCQCCDCGEEGKGGCGCQ